MSNRQYAHTYHYDNSICVAYDFDNLPVEHKAGILLHELGHLAAGRRASEDEANALVESITGITIEYVDSEHGHRLQYVDRETANVVLGSLFRLKRCKA